LTLVVNILHINILQQKSEKLKISQNLTPCTRNHTRLWIS